MKVSYTSCHNCGTTIPERRWKFCSDKCHQFFRYKLKRKNHNCLECGVDLVGTFGRKYCQEHSPCHQNGKFKPRYCVDCSTEITYVSTSPRCSPCQEKHTSQNSNRKSRANIKHHQLYPEQHKRTVQAANLKARVRAIVKLGGVCEMESFSQCKGPLELHHRNFDGHIDPLRRSGSAAMAREIRNMENPKEKYALLCRHHHKLTDWKHRLEEENAA